MSTAINANSQLLEKALTQFAEGGAKARQETNDFVEKKFAEKYSVEELKRKSAEVIDSLKFPGMWDRRKQILEPEEASFESPFSAFLGNAPSMESSIPEWINVPEYEIYSGSAQPGMESFHHWLRIGGSLFWVSGCVGSGKSTLLKLLEQECHDSLKITEDSDDEMPKEVLAHYFWRPGTMMQKSFKGLLYSLLHQVLSGHQGRINYVLEHYQRALDRIEYTDWKTVDLQQIFSYFLREASTTFILFIDGLDEIENDDELFKVLTFLESGGRSQHIRLCVSSRPEWIIRQKLQNYPRIKLQDLTQPSMMMYAGKILAPQLTSKLWEPRKQVHLCRRLVEKADGIFLWLVLTTSIIRRGVLQGEEEEQVYQNLDNLPHGLEGVFKDIWERMGDDFKSNRVSGATYIKFVLLYEKINHSLFWHIFPLRRNQFLPILLSVYPERVANILTADDLLERLGSDETGPQQNPILSQESLNQESPLRAWKPLGKWILAKADEMRLHCMGLLFLRHPETRLDDAQESPMDLFNSRIDFAHRSVYDFFTRTEAAQSILSECPLSYSDCCFRLAKALVVLPLCNDELLEYMLKHNLRKNHHHTPEDFLRDVLYLMTEGLESDPTSIEKAKVLLDYCKKRMVQQDLGTDMFSLLAGNEKLFRLLLMPHCMTPSVATSILRGFWRIHRYDERVEKINLYDMVNTLVSHGACVDKKEFIQPLHFGYMCDLLSFRTPFAEFTLVFWSELMRRRTHYRFPREIADFFACTRHLGALKAFLDAGPRLNELIAVEISGDGVFPTTVNRFDIRDPHSPCVPAEGDLGVVMIVSATVSWLCERILKLVPADCQTPIFDEILSALDGLRIAQGNPEDEVKLSAMYSYTFRGKPYDAYLTRTEFDEPEASEVVKEFLRSECTYDIPQTDPPMPAHIFLRPGRKRWFLQMMFIEDSLNNLEALQNEWHTYDLRNSKFCKSLCERMSSRVKVLDYKDWMALTHKLLWQVPEDEVEQAINTHSCLDPEKRHEHILIEVD